jgi:hypothetical protein
MADVKIMISGEVFNLLREVAIVMGKPDYNMVILELSLEYLRRARQLEKIRERKNRLKRNNKPYARACSLRDDKIDARAWISTSSFQRALLVS